MRNAIQYLQKIIWVTLLTMGLQEVSAQKQTEKLQFEQTRLDLGKLTCEDVTIGNRGLEIKFPYHNISDDTLFIINVKGSGGPFMPYHYPRQILPHEKGEITGLYYCKDRIGPTEKSMVVTFDTIRYPSPPPAYIAILRVRIEWIKSHEEQTEPR